MLKFTEHEVTFAEIPDEITLCINISNCPCHCPGCHSQHLWQDIGQILSYYQVDYLIGKNKGITCISFMGGDSDPSSINSLAEHIRYFYPNLKIAWYSGYSTLSDKINIDRFDYIKLGPYVEGLGGLNNPNTNQHLYKVFNNQLVDITHKFWKSSVIND